MEKRWIVKEVGDVAVVKRLAADCGFSEPIADLMVQRGIFDQKAAKEFFQPSLDDLYDPFLMKDMNKAVERLTTAIIKNERILIYGDYDVDGTTAVSLVYSFLKQYTSNLEYYIPDRYQEGYGLSVQGIDYAYSTNCKLVITLDCGIKSVEKIDYARTKGLDVIVCDHHFPGNELPRAVAVLDPKQPGCGYPYKELSGCGVGFKLMCAFAKIHNIPFSDLMSYLDLVAVSIASDIVQITGENRVLAYYGLIQLNQNPCIGLKEIIRELDIKHKLSIEDLVFRIGPRINAAGRMELGKKAVQLLTSTNSKDAAMISKEINKCNDDRRTIDRSITSEAMKMIADNQKLVNSKTTVLYNQKWKKGVIGIVASRLIETYYRPTIILTESNGFATGSARSVQGYDLYQAIEACSDLLESFGGHMYAAGLTMKKENIKAFEERFEQYVASTITPDQLKPTIYIDLEIPFASINDQFYRQISMFQPFGPGNNSPIFMSKNVRDFGTSRMVGPSREHLKLQLFQGDDTTKTISAIAFGQANHFDYIKAGKPFDICYSIEMNDFRGQRNLQLNIRDIKPVLES
ncbi:MAG: single-stranded-DNA-specific exonuclease RecJ [Bacteroidales bacterium]|nr:single-stranded-DNA-specific exonuclease RecJ [Bacteroidales bacterium]